LHSERSGLQGQRYTAGRCARVASCVSFCLCRKRGCLCLTYVAVRVVKVRASAMQAASNLVHGGMIKVYFGASGRVGKACHLAKAYCRQELGMADCVCDITTYLYPGCKIISGNHEVFSLFVQNFDLPLLDVGIMW